MKRPRDLFIYGCIPHLTGNLASPKQKTLSRETSWDIKFWQTCLGWADIMGIVGGRNGRESRSDCRDQVSLQQMRQVGPREPSIHRLSAKH